MKNKTESFQLAEMLYTRLNFQPAQIATLAATDEETVIQWITGNNWNALRHAAFSSKEEQLKTLYKMMAELTARSLAAGKDAPVSDSTLIKNYSIAISKLESEDTFGKTVEVAVPFTTWLLKRDIPFAKSVTLAFDEYMREKYKVVFSH